MTAIVARMRSSTFTKGGLPDVSTAQTSFSKNLPEVRPAGRVQREYGSWPVFERVRRSLLVLHDTDLSLQNPFLPAEDWVRLTW